MLVNLRVFTLLMCLMVGSAAQAAPYLQVYTPASVSVATYGGTYLEVNPGDTQIVYGSTGPLFKDSGLVVTQNYMPGVGSAQAMAQADYGALRLWAHGTGGIATIDYNGQPTLCTAAGNGSCAAAFTDTLYITSPGHVGDTGYVTFKIHIDGYFVGTVGHPGVYAGAGWEVRLDDDYYRSIGHWDYANNTYRTGGDFTLTKSFYYDYTNQFKISFTGMAPASYTNPVSELDYWGTTAITGLIVSDASGDPLADYTVTSGSGHDYATPEPQILALLAVGALTVLARRNHLR
jgi:hypothetical protein